MESCRHLKGAFDSFDLEIMERALDVALRTLKAHHVMGTERTSVSVANMSALGSKADIRD